MIKCYILHIPTAENCILYLNNFYDIYVIKKDEDSIFTLKKLVCLKKCHLKNESCIHCEHHCEQCPWFVLNKYNSLEYEIERLDI